jgi:hypothetical protein
MEPFDSYPGGDGQLLGFSKGSNCRHQYGLAFMQRTGQKLCAYCGSDFTATYEQWLTMALDHVIPLSVCKARGIPEVWFGCRVWVGHGDHLKPSSHNRTGQSPARTDTLYERSLRRPPVIRQHSGQHQCHFGIIGSLPGNRVPRAAIGEPANPIGILSADLIRCTNFHRAAQCVPCELA